MVITMAKLRMAHASTHAARKPPGPKWVLFLLMSRVVDIRLNSEKKSLSFTLQGIKIGK